MPTLPAASSFTGSTVTEAQFKTAITDQREFLAGLLGTAGTQAAALTTLGAALNGVLSKSAAYTVVAADRGKLIDATTGTWTLTLLAAATAGDGFVVGVRNSGTGVITIDPNSTEQIDGAATITLNAGESCLVVGSGTGWKTVAMYKDQRTDSSAVCKAWATFNGTTGSIVKAYGINSITKNAVGDYTVNFSANMPDANYCVVSQSLWGPTSDTRQSTLKASALAVNSVTVKNVYIPAGSGATLYDAALLWVAIFD